MSSHFQEALPRGLLSILQSALLFFHLVAPPFITAPECLLAHPCLLAIEIHSPPAVLSPLTRRHLVLGQLFGVGVLQAG